ncbi:MAG: PBP1A family penicillin-binding protein [Vampirovibrionales bacterium]|nr:PBP1A family penicillin-binding protein [Vampirovibrionales bacterium]
MLVHTMITMFFKFLVGALAVLGVVFVFNRSSIEHAIADPFTLPSMEALVSESALNAPPTSSSRILASDGTVILANGQLRHTAVKLNEVSPEFINALVATEDRRFYQHHGVDPLGVGRAIFVNLTSGNLKEGASTLTQQLVRMYLLSNERTLTRKLKEMILAWRVEDKLSKEQILERYINSVYFGHGAYGIYAASMLYFSKAPSQLTQSESALLAGLPQAPSNYDPIINPELAKSRRNEVIHNMVEAGYLKPEQAQWYQQQRLNLRAQSALAAAGNLAPYFNQYVLKWVQQKFAMTEGEFWSQGLQVHTTLDLRAQRLAEAALVNGSAAVGRTGNNKQGAMVVLDPKTGAVLAYVGGLGFENSQFDRVTLAKRPPGSLFKVFTYTAAIDSGIAPGTLFVDEPLTFDNWRPKNYDGQHHGQMSLVTALAQSNNIVAVKLIQQLGPDKVASLANRMGVESSLPRNLALTLGGVDVTLLEMTSAVATLANQGIHAHTFAISGITDAQGQSLYEAQPRQDGVLSSKTAQTMTQMLVEVITHGTGKAAQINRPVAGKTGTSDDHRDAWFVGYTPSVVAGVWMGNDDNTPMPKGTSGGGVPARIFARFMSSYLAKRDVESFDLTQADPLDATTQETPTTAEEHSEAVEEATVPSSEQPPMDNSAPETRLENAAEPSAYNTETDTPTVPSAAPVPLSAPLPASPTAVKSRESLQSAAN